MPTKTEQYLEILARGGDAPTSCCTTNEQKLIAEAIERINNLGGGATMFYADLHGVQSNLWIYTDSSQSDNVDSAAMIAALSRGPVMIKDMNGNNIYVTVVSANDANSPLGIVIDMYDDSDNPARRRFEYEGPDWVENPFN